MDINRLEELMIKELDVDASMIKLYLKLLFNGRMSIEGLEESIAKKLVEDGACIEMDGKYQALNPRFALTNMYRMQLLRKGMVNKRNPNIDRIAMILEGLLERRAK